MGKFELNLSSDIPQAQAQEASARVLELEAQLDGLYREAETLRQEVEDLQHVQQQTASEELVHLQV